MCSKLYLVDGMFLGNRLIGYELYEERTKGMIGMTEKQIISRLKADEKVYGFTLREEDGKETLVLDKEGFNMTNLQIKSGVNNLTWLNDNESDINIGLIVVSVSGDKKKVYETLNARHARVKYDEHKLRMMMELGIPVAGIRLEKNKLVICDGVTVTEGNSSEEKEGE